MKVTDETSSRRGTRLRRGGRKAQFTRDEVLGAALRLADRDGLEALTMQRLAQEMGVGTMTLYGYVGSKEEIYVGIAARVFGGLEIEVDSSASWDEQLRSAVMAIYDRLREHPAGVSLMLMSHTFDPHTLDHLREGLLSVLREAGMRDADAVAAISSLVGHVLGWLLVESTRARPDVSPGGEAARLRDLSEDEFPNLRAVADLWEGRTWQRSFEYGIAHLIAGIRDDLESAPESPA